MKNLKFLKFPVGGSRSQGFQRYLTHKLKSQELQSRRLVTGVLQWENPESAMASAPEGAQGARGTRGAPEGAEGNWGFSRECSRGCSSR